MTKQNLEQESGGDDELSTAINAIDTDDVKLFNLIESAVSMCQKEPNNPEVSFILQELLEYMHSHFRREHAILSVIKHPFYDDHVAKHKHLIQQVKQAIVELNVNQENAADSVSHIKQLFIEHINNTDNKIAQFITGHEKDIQKALIEVGSLTQHCCNKIFIVDDDIQQAQLMLEMTKAANLTATVFTSSLEFLETEISQFDIVILDLQMPEKDGIEIMRDLAAKNCKPNFILVSGFDERVLHSAKQLAESKQLNVISTLNKPIKAKHFIRLIKETFQQFRVAFLQQQINKTSAEFSVHSPLDQSHQNDVITIDELKTAIRQHQLVIHLQPQVSFVNRDIEGAEILVRWQHPTKGLIFPGQFIPLAEQHQLMNLLTEEILRMAIKEYQYLLQNNVNIKVSINLSAQNINDLSMPEKLEALVKHYQIKPESFVLEITESALMNEISESLDILNRLRMKGFSLSIDDFGTGYSSLVKLYQAPFTELKIDQHFIFRMATDPDAAAIVRICIMLAKELKMQTVAEGVETQEAWDQLSELGCNIAQGYFIAKPMPTDTFIAWVSDWNKQPSI